VCDAKIPADVLAPSAALEPLVRAYAKQMITFISDRIFDCRVHVLANDPLRATGQ
jgi:hypothetical protein